MSAADSTHEPWEVDFTTLPKYKKREFLPEIVNLKDAESVSKLYKKLLNKEINSRFDLENLILERSEFEAALCETGSILYIRMTCKTDDQDRAQEYQDFVQNVAPVVSKLSHELDEKTVLAIDKFGLDQERYGIYIRNKKTDIEIFREKNIELATKVALLSQEYQQVTGAMTAEFEGEEKTLTQISTYTFEPDAEIRESAWRTIAERRLKDKDKIEDIFDEMLKLRHEVAKNADFLNYRDYQFKAYHRFDYTAADCKKYHEAVEEVVMPVLAKFYEDRKQKMKVDTLRPWDLNVDPLGRKPLKPFEKVDHLIKGCRSIFNKIDPELGRNFGEMADLGLLDLENRKGKAPGGYQNCLSEARKPFIFMNAVGVDQDVRTLLHESGHSFHSFACADEVLYDYRHAPMEFCEVASMSMELLADPLIEEFYDEQDSKRSRLEHLEQVIDILPWVATVDRFQHWIYENPGNTRQDRAAKWKEIYGRYAGKLVDYSGLDEELGAMWHRQLHIFEVPFYYIEYAIAQIGALQIWLNAKSDQTKALNDYKNALKLGGSMSLPRLFESANIKFDFSKETIKPLMDAVGEELEKLK